MKYVITISVIHDTANFSDEIFGGNRPPLPPSVTLLSKRGVRFREVSALRELNVPEDNFTKNNIKQTPKREASWYLKYDQKHMTRSGR